jgi:hypothetical protein
MLDDREIPEDFIPTSSLEENAEVVNTREME